MTENQNHNQDQGAQTTGGLSKAVTYTVLGALVLIAIAAGVVGYFWFVTQPETVLIAPRDLPAGVTVGFGPDELGNRVLSALYNIGRASSGPQAPKPVATQGLQVVNLPPLTTTASTPLPIFDVEVYGVSFKKLRALGIAWKARSLLELEVVGMQNNKFRLSGMLKDKPEYELRGDWKVPSQGSCDDLDLCVAQLAEGVYGVLAPRALISFYLEKDTKEAYEKVAHLYRASMLGAKLENQDYLVLGTALVRTRQDSEAQKVYEMLSQNAPQYCTGFLIMGSTYLQRYAGPDRQADDLARAETGLRKAVECDPQSAAANNNLGNVLMRKWTAGGRRDPTLAAEAMGLFSRARKLDLKLAEPAVNIGYLLYQQGETEKGLSHFEEISREFPQSPSLFLNYGFLHYLEYRKGKEDALQPAIQQTDRAWKLDKSSYGAANNLGFYYYEAGSLNEAAKYLELADSLEPNSVDTLAGLALIRFKQGDVAAARNLYLRALKGDPKSSDPEYLGKAYLWGPRATTDISPLSAQIRSQSPPT